MVSPKHDDGLIAQSVLVQAPEQSTDLMIGETHAGQIPMDQLALKRFWKGALRRHVGVGPQFAAILQRETRRAGRRLLERGQCDFLRIVQIPVFFRCDKRQVRFEEPDGKEPRLIGGGLLANRFDGGICDQRVVVELLGCIGRLEGRCLGFVLGVFRVLVFRGLVIPSFGFVRFDAPGFRIVGIPMTHMENFSKRLGVVPLRFEMLRQADRFGGTFAEVGLQVIDPERLGP